MSYKGKSKNEIHASAGDLERQMRPMKAAKQDFDDSDGIVVCEVLSYLL